MKKPLVLLLAVVLFAASGITVWADDGDGQAVLPGQNVVVRPGEVMRGDLAVIGGDLELQQGGRVNGDVVVLGGGAVIDGEIDGNLAVLGGTVDLRSHARVGGDLFTLGATVTRDPAAIIEGQTVESFRGRLPRLPEIPENPDWQPTGPLPRSYWEPADILGRFIGFVLSTMAMIALGILLVMLLPRPTETVEAAVAGAFIPSLALGVLTFLVLIVLVPLLILICIGIPVAVLLVMAAVAAAAFGWSAAGIWLGRRLLTQLKGQPQPVIAAVIGITVLTALSQLPCLGWMLGAVTGAAGLGAVVLTRFGTAPYPRPTAPVTPLEPPPPVPGESTGL